MLGIYVLAVYLYVGIAVGFYNYLTTPKQSHKQIDQEAREYWHTTYTCSEGGDK